MIINVKVKPKSGKSEIIEVVKDKDYIINVKAEPENNKANIELINLLAKYFKVSSNNIKIKRGLTSRNKIVEINN
ncbi:MAG: DUF167 domain-containing protein [Candidatus Pacearchaeota archaeon]|jgi:hypothetical protein